MNNLEQRVQHLEETLAFQDEVIDSLNEVVIDQQKQLDTILQELEKLQGALSAMGEQGPQSPEPPPPHY